MRTKPSWQSRNLHGMARRAASALAVFVATLLGVASLTAQTGTISGRVIDAQTAQPIASAQVVISALSIGSLTQQNGRFVLQNVPPGVHTVAILRIGYQTAQATVAVEANGVATQDFSITQTALSLDEIIITGTPGGTERRALGNSVAAVNAATITEQAVITGVQDLLSARTPGLRFGRVDGQVGGGSGITIRGVSSMTLGAQPLIYIDGVRVDNDATKGPTTSYTTGGETRGNASAMGDINPDDIESIQIIKGPAAATLYGTEASAGVIQIITKKGQIGAPEFTMEVGGGINYMRDPAGVLGDSWACKTTATKCPEDQLVRYNMYDEANDYLRHQGRYAGLNLPFPARDEDLFGHGIGRRFALSARGGTDQVRYFLSTTLANDVGAISYNTDASTNLRGNISVLLSDNLTIDVSTGYGQGRSQFATFRGEGGVWHQLVWNRGPELPGVLTPEGTKFLGFQERWPQDYENTDVSRDFSKFTGSATGTHTIGEWFTQRLVFGVDRGWETHTEYLPGGSNIPIAPNGMLTYTRPIEQNVTLDYAASIRRRLSSSVGTQTSIGVQYYTNFEESFENQGFAFSTPVQTVISDTDGATRIATFTSIENKSLGIYIDEQLNLFDRLYLNAAVRADDNSAFGSEFDLQYYPKISASYVISDESFFNVAGVDNLRLRGAWGKAGRQPGTFASQTIYGTMVGPNGNGLVPTTAGNPEIGPEVSTEIEVGLDMSLFQDRLSGEFSWYNTKTEDALVNQALAPSTGLTGQRQANLGELRNWGWEAALNARLVESTSMSLDLMLSGDYTKNEIVSLGQDVLPTGNLQLGWPFPSVTTNYLLRGAEFDANGNLDRSTVVCDGGVPAVSGGPNIMPGGETILCSEYTAQGILLGPSYPNYTFAVSPTLTVLNGNLQVFALAEGQFGRWIGSTDAQFACVTYFNCKANVVDSDPMFIAAISAQSRDERYIGRYPADFWKLRQIGVRYNIPNAVVTRFGADRASITVSGNNIMTLWQKTKTDLAGASIYDPELSVNGDVPGQTALGGMPALTRYSAALRVIF